MKINGIKKIKKFRNSTRPAPLIFKRNDRHLWPNHNQAYYTIIN